MSTHIKLSQNELLALLTRTFEALFGHERDYYDMAKTVLWLECHGHHGVEQMISALPVLEHDNLAKPALSELSSNHIVIDGSGRSLICLSQADVAYPTVYKNNGIDSLSLICAQTDEKLSDYFSQTPDVLVDVSTQKDAFVSSLEHGLNIKRVDYNALTMIANRVLVEATEASRQGAGE